MYTKTAIFVFFALVAMAAAEPKPQVLVGSPYAYAAAHPLAYTAASPYVAAAPYAAAPYAAAPYAVAAPYSSAHVSSAETFNHHVNGPYVGAQHVLI